MWLHVLVLMASQAWDSHDESESSNSVFQQEHAQENPHQGNASQATSETFYNGIVNTARLLIKRLTYFGIFYLGNGEIYFCPLLLHAQSYCVRD